MAESNKIKVIGYAQRVFYNDGIEYRNFSDDLVGNQQTNNGDGGSSVFTFGNFVTTTNYEGKVSRLYSTKKFGDFYCLENMELNLERAQLLLNNNVNVTLNLDNTNLCNFAYFGSSTEFVRVSLENIITNWPASLYLTPTRETDLNTLVGDTVIDYSYDNNFNKGTFKVDTDFIDNKFDINYKKNGEIIDTFNEGNDLRNLTVNFSNYVILFNETEYPIIGFTASTYERNDFISFEVIGNPFTNINSGSTKSIYHIKPKKELEEQFFNSLAPFENNLLSRITSPKYTSKYEYKQESDSGVINNKRQVLTWPVTDGYNIDFDTTNYITYVTSLLDITTAKDGTETDLITRFLTSESISDFDTVPICDGTEEEHAGQKMNKTLKIYGREFDEIKKYIDGISFANVVSYDKKENTPDQLVKYLARILGWGLTSSIVDNGLISTYLNVSSRTYPGYSRGLTSNEAEIELWRRLILNSAWIWKSKGTRKSIEFFFNLIGTPDGLINFQEYVYVADEPIDMDLFYSVLEYNQLKDDLNLYNVDSDGYPKFFRDTSDMYFQKGGQWYRQTAGSGATQYVLEGNNPHVGPYDGGKEYIAQLENIIPNFSAFTITSTTITTGTTQIFTNYNSGLFNQYTGDTYVDLQNDNGIDLTDIVSLNVSIIDDPCPMVEKTECGCDIPEDDEALLIDVIADDLSQLQLGEKCDDLFSNYSYNGKNGFWVFDYILYDQYGVESINVKKTPFVSQECCDTLVGGHSYYAEDYTSIPPKVEGEESTWELYNSGYFCCESLGITKDFRKEGCGCSISCQWILAGPSLADMWIDTADNYAPYLKFIDPAGNERVVNKADSCFCPSNYSVPSIITDPFTGEEGYGCKMNDEALAVMVNTPVITNELYQIFLQRAYGQIDCKSDVAQPVSDLVSSGI